MKKAPAAGRLYDEGEEPTYESRGGGWYEKEKQTFPSPTPAGVSSSSSSSFFFPFLRGREARQKSGSFSSFLPQRSLAQERPPPPLRRGALKAGSRRRGIAKLEGFIFPESFSSKAMGKFRFEKGSRRRREGRRKKVSSFFAAAAFSSPSPPSSLAHLEKFGGY